MTLISINNNQNILAENMKMYLEISQNALRTEHIEAGFRLMEEEHLLYLYDGEGTRRCIFSCDGATAYSIQSEVDVLMRN